jgi:hypothetical protein
MHTDSFIRTAYDMSGAVDTAFYFNLIVQYIHYVMQVRLQDAEALRK